MPTVGYVNVADGQADGQTDDLRYQYRALHYVHRAVKITPMVYAIEINIFPYYTFIFLLKL